ncbi:hypothetical protein G7054_g11826 [Neopestalotiopsis clavispora]|nr:hypothetical protein G7054_g11826 [Neopestalotiopsis clavispora]
MAVHTTAILILFNLLLGILFAIAHHVFYESLDGKVVVDQHQQEWYLRIGTGLSFAVRTLLSASIGSAYVQLIWYNVNCMGTVENTPFVDCGRVVTSATLTIEAARDPRAYEIALPLPVPDYTEPWKYADIDHYAYEFHQGSSRILRLFNSVTSLGTILAIHPPFPNSSYTLNFYGPSIACESLPPGSNLKQLIGNLFRDEDGYYSDMPYYAGFIPNSYCGNVHGCPNKEEDDDVAISALRQTLNSTLVNNLITYDNVSEEYAKVYVLVHNSASDPPFTSIECSFYNSSYLVKANFIDGQQEISYTSTKLNGISSRSVNLCYQEYSEPCGAGRSYLAFIDALGKIMIGTLSDDDSYSITPTRTQILTTVLSQSWEFRILPQMQQGPKTIANMSLAEALEQIVTNTTLSLLSDSYFL